MERAANPSPAGPSASAVAWTATAAFRTLRRLARGVRPSPAGVDRLLAGGAAASNLGLSDLRHLESVLVHELHRAERSGRPLSVLLIDVDHLRRIDTTLGRVCGDRALRLVAMSLRAQTRDHDVAARLGDDELCLLLPETSIGGALAVGERIRADVEASGEGAGFPLTVSIGVACARPGVSAGELVLDAGRGAYRAKAGGRNAVALPPPDPVAEAERLLSDAAGEAA